MNESNSIQLWIDENESKLSKWWAEWGSSTAPAHTYDYDIKSNASSNLFFFL
jgi:hypothetical protein